MSAACVWLLMSLLAENIPRVRVDAAIGTMVSGAGDSSQELNKIERATMPTQASAAGIGVDAA